MTSTHSSAYGSNNSHERAEEEEGRIALADDAPPVDLTLLVVENQGLQVISHSEMGRVVVSTKGFDSNVLYKPILREHPALVCKVMDHMSFMEEFLEAPLEIQVGILDMFYQPLDSPMGQSLVEPAKLLFLIGVLEDFRVIHQLLAIWMTNGFQYQGDQSAVPLFASKFAHSCNPNVGYSSNSVDGCLEYKLLRPIQKGELACFSYLSDLFETPTSERRQLLMETKSFWCRCERCMGPDYCRAQKCNTCSKLIPCQYTTNEHCSPYWECPDCGLLETFPYLHSERELEKALQLVDRATEQMNGFNKRTQYSVTTLQEMVRDCITSLSSTHYLTIKALRILVKVATSNAYVHIKKLMVRALSLDDPNVHSLLRSSVVAGFQLILACECVAANCTGCYLSDTWAEDDKEDNDPMTKRNLSGVFQIHHEPNYDRATPMRHMCETLLQLPVFWWPPIALTMVQRYMPILQAKLGTEASVFEQGLVQEWGNVTCLECGTYFAAPAFQSGSSRPKEE